MKFEEVTSMGKKAMKPEMVNIAQRIGRRIRLIRIQKGLKQSHVAKLAGIPVSRLSKIETVKVKSIDVPTLFKIARAMDVSCDELCNVPIDQA
jgi:transcriptional regulator with XRE-family HTH domain